MQKGFDVLWGNLLDFLILNELKNIVTFVIMYSTAVLLQSGIGSGEIPCRHFII